jgi:D-alanine-D-alanine ligase-like ATP-grasp enzyme
MFDLTRHPRLFRLLALADRLQQRLRSRPPDGRQADANLTAFYARIWKEAAAALGAEIRELSRGVWELRRGAQQARVASHVTPLDSLLTGRLSRLKGLVYRLVSQAGLPVPQHCLFHCQDLAPARDFLEKTGRECVVKPAQGSSGGQGVTTQVRSANQLAWAAWFASRYDEELLIEEQHPGDNYRLLYLDGRLLDAVRRRPPTVVGDGRATVRQLLEQANARRLTQGAQLAHVPLRLDLDLRRTLARQGLSLRSIPAAGQRIVLKTATNENSWEDNEAVLHLVSPLLAAEGAQAAALVGARLAGVDVLTTDPGRSLKEAGGVLLEVNVPPGFYWHYCRQGGPPCPVAQYVLQALWEEPLSQQPAAGGEAE